MKEKKPTMKQVKTVVTNALLHMAEVQKHLQQIDGLLFNYITFKGDKEKFGKYLDKEAKNGEAARSSDKGNKQTT